MTSGPFLALDVDGAGMGAELQVEAGTRVLVVAEARLNPDVDALDRLELVVAGEVVATEPARGRSGVELRTDLVRRYQGELDEMMSEPLDPDEDLEPWETREILPREWDRQRELLRDRVEEARDRLDDRLERARRGMGR